MKGMLPEIREVEMGRIEVRQVYKITNVEQFQVVMFFQEGTKKL